MLKEPQHNVAKNNVMELWKFGTTENKNTSSFLGSEAGGIFLGKMHGSTKKEEEKAWHFGSFVQNHHDLHRAKGKASPYTQGIGRTEKANVAAVARVVLTWVNTKTLRTL